MQHILEVKEQNGVKINIAVPRFTQIAAFANQFVLFRSGTDVALIPGIEFSIRNMHSFDALRFLFISFI